MTLGNSSLLIERLVILFIFLAPFSANFYKYYYTKNYDYIIETPCDIEQESCYLRDCSNPDDCPPNGLTEYKMYSIKAYDFKKCSDNTCESECSQNIIECTPIPCGESDEDTCSSN